jgi:CheY-like chemotaxis protein
MSKVLIVDDTAVDRRLAGGLLENAEGLEVVYAENGKAALDIMAEDEPDIVLTDLQMPEMDGLQLITHIRSHHPNVPVILMTGHGSESTAVDALERGASSYVPKKQLNKHLRETVQDVLSLARADKSYNDLLECQTRVEFSYELKNDPALIDALVDLVQQIIGGLRLTDHTGKFRVGVALREALNNALYHGNLEVSESDVEDAREALLEGEQGDVVALRRFQAPYRDRRICVDVRITRQEARFVIQDDGSGFDYASLLSNLDLCEKGAFDGDRGRGFVLMLSFMDEVSFNESGNRVTMVKRRDDHAEPATEFA